MVKMTTANIMHSKRCSASKSDHICGNLKKKAKEILLFHTRLSAREIKVFILLSLVWYCN